MGRLLDAALSFPTVVLTPLLVAVLGYWLVVLAGGSDPDGDTGSGAAGGGVLALVGLGGVPPMVALSLLVAFGWFASLTGAQLFGAALPVLAAALLVGWLATRLSTAALRKVLRSGAEPSRADFVGLTCVIRTGRVTADFGQAEVRAPDGSSAVVQVRQAGHDPLSAGSSALLYDVDATGEYFWVVPTDVALHPEPPAP